MARSAAAALLLLLLLGVAAAAAAAATPRGVSEAQADQYALAGGKFKCLDGSKTIPAKQVNDNYCDCPDGSDEPGACCVGELCARGEVEMAREWSPQCRSPAAHNAGTSACPNGSFYCRNRGHEPKVLSSAFVDDGICGELGGDVCLVGRWLGA